jgi:PhzF family phenazine biosynthesis protein
MISRRRLISASPLLIAGTELLLGPQPLRGQIPGNQVDVVHARVFAASPGGGSPCPVIPFADSLTDAQMQGLSIRFGQDTAFVLKAPSPGADIRIRYFVPGHEMGISAHAILVAIACLRSAFSRSSGFSSGE